MIEKIKKHKCGLGFYSEQGFESIHQVFGNLSANYGKMGDKLPKKRTRYMMEKQMRQTAPDVQRVKREKAFSKQNIKKLLQNNNIKIATNLF